MIYKIIFIVIIFPLCIAFGYFISKWIRSYNIANALKYSSDNYYKRAKTTEEFQMLYGNNDNKVSKLTKMDTEIEMSGLRSRFSWLTSEILIAFVSVVTVTAGIIAAMFLKNFLLTVAVVAIVLFAYRLMMKMLVEKNLKRIDDGLVEFVNQLFSYSNASNDLVTIVGYAVPYLNEPLYTVMHSCVQESRMTGNVDLAFQRVNLKLKHRQLNMFLDNLVECSHNSANYKEVINRSYETISVYVANKEKRTAIAKEGNVAIIAMLIVLFVSLIFILISFVKQSPSEFFFSSFGGQCVFGTFLFTCLFALWKILNMGKEK